VTTIPAFDRLSSERFAIAAILKAPAPAGRKPAREGRIDYLLVESGIRESLPAESRLGRRTVLSLPLLPPPQKN
jgi:hypothetical protein